ncbi:acid protease [Lentinula aciculospora]|uniref:Acid protease n=1 Tax=Lentinula aciculospora TaxID=153920 RepID=A0A9W9DTR8_9AGAR|nr:acid protease [Lentinula aciculospora]
MVLTRLLLTTSSFCIAAVHAISFDISGRVRDPSSSLIQKRASPSIEGSFGNGSSSVVDSGDITYTCNITLGGTVFEVQIDTGSADLWVIGDIPGTSDTGISSNLSYGKGSVSGTINTATLIFDDFQIENQAYIKVDKVNQINDAIGTGLIGLGPSRGSGILKKIGSPAGDPPLDRIFKQNMTTPNFISILLSRTDEQSAVPNASSQTLVPLLDEQPGQLTIGEVIPEYQGITNTSKLSALVETATTNQHWMTLLDSNGIIGPDGNRINTTSKNGNTDEGQSDQLRVVFDTGFTQPQVPPTITDALYGRVPGASFHEDYNLWQVPCDYELNVTFVLASTEYPLHPLDLTSFVGTDDGETVCVGWFQPIAENLTNGTAFGSFDAILGMAFLRNTYLLINFGDFIDGSNSTTDPFMQLFSTVDRAIAHLDFVNTRLGGNDTTSSQEPLLPVEEGQTSQTPGAQSSAQDLVHSKFSDDKSDDKPVYQRTWFIVVISVCGAIILAAIGGIIYTLMRRSRRSNIPSEGPFVPPMGAYKLLLTKTDGVEHTVPLYPYSDHESSVSEARYRDPYYEQ